MPGGCESPPGMATFPVMRSLHNEPGLAVDSYGETAVEPEKPTCTCKWIACRPHPAVGQVIARMTSTQKGCVVHDPNSARKATGPVVPPLPSSDPSGPPDN